MLTSVIIINLDDWGCVINGLQSNLFSYICFSFKLLATVTKLGTSCGQICFTAAIKRVVLVIGLLSSKLNLIFPFKRFTKIINFPTS